MHTLPFIPAITKPLHQSLDDCVVLFFDMANFVELTRDFRDKDVVFAMHYCFSAFEPVIESAMGKIIKTNADQCLVLFIQPDKDDIWPCIIELFRQFYSICHYYGVEGQLRCGAHRGSLVAGYIGSNRRYFDIWGKTVNMASRLERHAKLDSISMSETFFFEFCPYQTLTLSAQHLKSYGQLRTAQYDFAHLRYH